MSCTSYCLSSLLAATCFARWLGVSMKYCSSIACRAWPSASSLEALAAYSWSAFVARNSWKSCMHLWNSCRYFFMYTIVSGIWLPYCAMRQKPMIARTQRIAIMQSPWAATGRLGASFICRTVAARHANKTQLPPRIFILLHIVICRYRFPGYQYPEYIGMLSYILSKTSSRLCFFKKPSVHSIRYFITPRRILYRIFPQTMRCGVMLLRVYSTLVNGLIPSFPSLLWISSNLP